MQAHGATSKVMLDLSGLIEDEITADEAKTKALIESVQPITIEVPTYAEGYIRTHPGYAANYNDELIYVVDKWLREWHEKVKDTSEWKVKSGRGRKYGFSELFKMIFGRDYVPKEDAKNSAVIARVFAYYATKAQKVSFVQRTGKTTKKVYTFSDKRFAKQPYSLRLRVEEAGGFGEIQDKYGTDSIKCYLRLPKNDLKMGHARAGRTEANMQRRSAEAKARANAIQNKATLKWKHKQKLIEEAKKNGSSDN